MNSTIEYYYLDPFDIGEIVLFNNRYFEIKELLESGKILIQDQATLQEMEIEKWQIQKVVKVPI